MLILLAALLSAQLAEPAILQIVPLESLAEKYQQFDGREIVIAGIVTFGPEVTLIYLPGPARPGEREAIFVTLPLSLSRGELEVRYLERQKNRASTVAVLRGRFRGDTKRIFGHQGCCRFELEITKVLSVG